MANQLAILGGTAGAHRVEPRWSLLASLALHCFLLLTLFRGRSPIFVAPASALGGANGTEITHLYWSAATRSPESGSASDLKQDQNSHAPVTWKNRQRTNARATRDTPTPEPGERRRTAAAAVLPPPAGSLYGSLSDGNPGQEIRPALPVTTSEPLVSADDLRGSVEGNVVVEITIDENGNIVHKVVVQSLGPAIDGKVLAALENWHFRPATRDGVPIPSRQDVVYHFKPS
jgi:TonB family protein